MPVSYCCLHLDICGYSCGTGLPHWDRGYGGFSTGLKTEGGSPICPLFVSMARDGRTGQEPGYTPRRCVPASQAPAAGLGAVITPVPGSLASRV